MKKKLWILLIIISLLIQPVTTNAGTRTLTETQKETADTLARVCIENWDTYGVLPSVCIAQAFVESTLGKFCSGYNLWGIRRGEEQYDSLEEGVIRYLEVINNGYYENAPFSKDYEYQLSEILAGGYCQPVGDYYSDAIWIIENYDLAEYDQMLFDELERREYIKKTSNPFLLSNNDELPSYLIAIDTDIIPEGSTVCIYINDILYGIYDTVPDTEHNGKIIKINDEKLHGIKCSIVVYTDAKG